MRRKLVLLGTIAALFAIPWSALAQRTTGDIRGVITDQSGAVLPGVTVTLRGPGRRRGADDRDQRAGIYRFPNLPPGTYDITAELAGFTTSAQTGIPVALGGTAEVNVQLKVSTQSETITVVAESPVVDSTTTQVSTNYSREWIENAPGAPVHLLRSDQRSAGRQPRRHRPSSRSQSFGSATNENMYLLDGTDFTAPLTGAAWPWPNTDAIEEVQVLSLGAPADYGNLAGAVFNVVTRQGSNTFRGDANFYFQNQGLTGRNTDDDQDDGLPYHRDEFKDTTVQLGGPVRQGQVLVLRIVPVSEGRRFAAWHRAGVPGALVGQAVLLQAQLPDQSEQSRAVPDARRLLPHSRPRHGQHRAQHASASRPATILRRAFCGRR